MHDELSDHQVMVRGIVLMDLAACHCAAFLHGLVNPHVVDPGPVAAAALAPHTSCFRNGWQEDIQGDDGRA